MRRSGGVPLTFSLWSVCPSLCVCVCACSGRNSFKPISGYVNVEYIQRMDISAVMPVKKLYHSAETNLLYAFDGDSPVVRCIR